LTGVGINFSFVEKTPPVELLKLFNVGDARAIEKRGWESPEVGLVRKLTGDHGILNLILAFDGAAVTIDLNFHTETPGKTLIANSTAREAVDGHLMRLRGEAISFIGDIYNLRLEGDDGDE
jgi:hypothetical protein